MIKLILSDIDGTLLPFGAHVVSERTRRALALANEAGIVCGPCTGRVYGQLPPLFANESACTASAVATNGSQVFLRGKKIEEIIIPYELLCALKSEVERIPRCGMLVFKDTTPYLVAGKREDLDLHFPSYADICIPTSQMPTHPVVKTNVFMAEPEQGTRAVIDHLNRCVDGLDFDYPRVGFSNVMLSGHNKATGIDTMVKALGISYDEVVVFGDAGNDLTMFSKVPASVAVAGATPEAAAAARYHIGACEDDSVACAIEMLAQNIWPFSS